MFEHVFPYLDEEDDEEDGTPVTDKTSYTHEQYVSGAEECLLIEEELIQLEKDDPDYLEDRFVRFSYRFKFDDNEYSVIAPFSQDVFIPEQNGEFLNDDETNAFVSTVVEFMQNSINNAVLNIKLPCIDIINEYKITGIEIIFTESDKQAYQVLEKIKVNSDFIASLNYTNIYQYSYQSTKPINTLPAFETTRV